MPRGEQPFPFSKSQIPYTKEGLTVGNLGYEFSRCFFGGKIAKKKVVSDENMAKMPRSLGLRNTFLVPTAELKKSDRHADPQSQTA